MKPRWIEVNDLMQQDYAYLLTEPDGRNFHLDFQPELTPKQMLELGVFGGRYMTDCAAEYPADWFENARLRHDRHDPELNYFGINASQPLSVWQEKGWIRPEDPRGWFQWYCRYYLGRRGCDDERQIRRWRAIRRHVAQVKKNCRRGDLTCRRKQRQVSRVGCAHHLLISGWPRRRSGVGVAQRREGAPSTRTVPSRPFGVAASVGFGHNRRGSCVLRGNQGSGPRCLFAGRSTSK